MTKRGRSKLIRTAIGFVIPALIGAMFGTISSLLVFRYQQATNVESLQTAFLGEIEAILVAVRGPAREAVEAWEQKRSLADHKFYYPHAVFDGNVAHLGELRDKQLVHDITHLYSMLNHAREEGRRLEAGTSDLEGRLRYAHYLCVAFAKSVSLVTVLSGDFPKINTATTVEAQQFNAFALKLDNEFLNESLAKFQNALFPEPLTQTETKPTEVSGRP